MSSFPRRIRRNDPSAEAAGEALRAIVTRVRNFGARGGVPPRSRGAGDRPRLHGLLPPRRPAPQRPLFVSSSRLSSAVRFQNAGAGCRARRGRGLGPRPFPSEGSTEADAGKSPARSRRSSGMIDGIAVKLRNRLPRKARLGRREDPSAPVELEERRAALAPSVRRDPLPRTDAWIRAAGAFRNLACLASTSSSNDLAPTDPALPRGRSGAPPLLAVAEGPTGARGRRDAGRRLPAGSLPDSGPADWERASRFPLIPIAVALGRERRSPADGRRGRAEVAQRPLREARKVAGILSEARTQET